MSVGASASASSPALSAVVRRERVPFTLLRALAVRRGVGFLRGGRRFG
jgi:hypothetical protein